MAIADRAGPLASLVWSACAIMGCGSDDSPGAAQTTNSSSTTSTSGSNNTSAGGSGIGSTATSADSAGGTATSGNGASVGGANGASNTGGVSSGGGTGGAGGSSSDAGGAAGAGGSGPSASVGCDTIPYDESAFSVLEVGPDRMYQTPSDVPWESIGPGTLVKIHARSEAYRDKWVLNVPGTAEAPVVVRGIPEDGQLPVITGDDALTRPELNFTNEARAIIKVGTSNVPDNETPSHIRIECLDLVGARPGLSFTNHQGDTEEFADNAAAAYIETGHDITVENCMLHGAGNGLFSAWASSNVVVRGNYIFDNGNVDSIYEHNSYTESNGITFEFNRYGSLCDGCLGNNLKDRSAGTLIRYNWIENGNRQLDLVETGHDELAELPEYRETHVYGNVLLEGDAEGNSQILHYGGDGDGDFRAGTLYFYHNTVVSSRSGNTTLARLSTDAESLEASNNVFFASAGGSSFAILDGSGNAQLEGNFLPTGWRETHGSLSGSLTEADNVVGDSPGFIDAGSQDFGLISSAPARDIAVALPAALDGFSVELQYVVHQSAAPRTSQADAGAFEGE